MDWRCDLGGELNGGGTFNYAMPSGGIRATLFGDWSGFSGIVNATGANSEFRMGTSYVYPGLEEGTLLLTGSLTSTGDVEVFEGAIFKHTGAGACRVDSMHVADGGTFDGAVTIAGDLNNDGAFLVPTGTLSVGGNLTNNGTLRLTGGASFSVTGTFINNGVLDLLTGAQSLPAGLVNNGVIIDASSLRMVSVARSGSTVTLTAQTYLGHSYQLQRSDSLTAPNWTNIGPAKSGNDAAQTFPDPAATGAQGFYRIVVTP